jgi:hypothetical protein
MSIHAPDEQANSLVERINSFLDYYYESLWMRFSARLLLRHKTLGGFSQWWRFCLLRIPTWVAPTIFPPPDAWGVSQLLFLLFVYTNNESKDEDFALAATLWPMEQRTRLKDFVANGHRVQLSFTRAGCLFGKQSRLWDRRFVHQKRNSITMYFRAGIHYLGKVGSYQSWGITRKNIGIGIMQIG